MNRRTLANRLAWTAAGVGLVLAGTKFLQPKMDLEGKVVLITGGSRGLGLAIAEEFAHKGAKLVLCAREEDELKRAKKYLALLRPEILTIPCDVSDPASVQHLVGQATNHFGRIDILVNDAGIISAGPLETLTREDFEESMNIIFWGTYNVTMAVLPQMQERKSGNIVNITSIGGLVSVPHLLSYSTAKFATVGFSEGLRAELAKDGIKVTTVAPGLMRTGSTINTTMKGSTHKEDYTAFTLLDTLPFTSISAQRAAQQIVAATQRGSAELIISIQAQLMARAHGLLPGIMTDLFGLANRFLPSGEGAGTQSHTGRESETPITRSFVTKLGQKASQKYNEE